MITSTVICPHIIVDEDNYTKPCDEELVVTMFHDAQYGADADGHRGMPAYFLEDIQQPHCSCELTNSELDKILEAAIENA